jgi:hypothetical protein
MSNVDEELKKAIRESGMIWERARVLGLARVTVDASLSNAENEDERNAIRALGMVLINMILHPEIEAKRPMTAEPALPPKGSYDPVRLDMFQTLITEFLRARQGQVLTPELIDERARNGSVYLEESTSTYERPDQTDPCMQVLLARAADSKH